MEVKRVEKHIINKNDDFYNVIDELCFKSRSLYNYANYIVRQEFFKTSKEKKNGERENAIWIRRFDLQKLCKDSEIYKSIDSNIRGYIIKILDENWKGFFAAIKAWKNSREDYESYKEWIKHKPRPPKYKKEDYDRFVCILYKDRFKITDDGYIHFGYKPLRDMNGKVKTHIPDGSKLVQLRFVPKKNEYVMEIVYEIEIDDVTTTLETSDRIASIDIGVNNLMTVTTNCGVSPIVINGKPLKSINQYYNKKLAVMKSEVKKRNGKDTSNEIRRFCSKRDHKVDDYMHKASSIVVEFCKNNEIDTLVCGHNDNWKQKCNIGKKNNQNLISIPHTKLIWLLNYKCQNSGILFIENEESYTSGTSFLDGEEPIKENYNKSRRNPRGLFHSDSGKIINSDVNGSYQIMKKVFPNTLDGKIGEAGYHPTIINIPA